MSEVAVLRGQLHHFHEYLEATMEGVTEQHAHWLPSGTANPPGATYAHVIFNEDDAIQRIVQGRQPPADSATEAGTAVDTRVPVGVTDWSEWGRHVRVTLKPLREFGALVYQATDDYLASVGDADLERQVDLSRDGFGLQPVRFVLHMLLFNAAIHTGEIACLKGLQGLRGAPNRPRDSGGSPARCHGPSPERR